eukprot:PhF_6_TR36149/c5_g1_i1/m.52548
MLKPSRYLVGSPVPTAKDEVETTLLRIKIISGLQLPKPNREKKGEIIDPYVEVFVSGFKEDDTTDRAFRTKVINNNGWHPVWNEATALRVTQPEMALVVLRVWDSDIGTDDFIGESIAPLDMIRGGFRSVPLKDAQGHALLDARLLIHISIEKTKARVGGAFNWHKDEPNSPGHRGGVGGGFDKTSRGGNALTRAPTIDPNCAPCNIFVGKYLCKDMIGSCALVATTGCLAIVDLSSGLFLLKVRLPIAGGLSVVAGTIVLYGVTFVPEEGSDALSIADRILAIPNPVLDWRVEHFRVLPSEREAMAPPPPSGGKVNFAQKEIENVELLVRELEREMLHTAELAGFQEMFPQTTTTAAQRRRRATTMKR